MKRALFTGVIGAVAVGAQAVTLASWNFDTTVVSAVATTNLAPIAADTGTGSLTSQHATAAVFSTPAGNGSPQSVSANTYAVGDYWQIQTSTTGFQGVNVTFDQTGSNTGPRDFVFQYSTNGTTFTTFGAQYSITNDAWSSAGSQNPISTRTFDLSSVSALNNQANVWFRITVNTNTSINAGTVATGGTGRIDNVIVSANPVPEPATLAALGLGAIAMLRRRRR